MEDGPKTEGHIYNLGLFHVKQTNCCDVVVVGAGVAGLTAAALLAKQGLQVQLLEAHSQTGGCAGTFRRGPYPFDVGATQVAGLEPTGIHARLFRHLGGAAPEATALDPGCVVDRGDGSSPIALWRDPERWQAERRRQFPAEIDCIADAGVHAVAAGRDVLMRRIPREENAAVLVALGQ